MQDEVSNISQQLSGIENMIVSCEQLGDLNLLAIKQFVDETILKSENLKKKFDLMLKLQCSSGYDQTVKTSYPIMSELKTTEFYFNDYKEFVKSLEDLNIQIIQLQHGDYDNEYYQKLSEDNLSSSSIENLQEKLCGYSKWCYNKCTLLATQYAAQFKYFMTELGLAQSIVILPEQEEESNNYQCKGMKEFLYNNETVKASFVLANSEKQNIQLYHLLDHHLANIMNGGNSVLLLQGDDVSKQNFIYSKNNSWSIIPTMMSYLYDKNAVVRITALAHTNNGFVDLLSESDETCNPESLFSDNLENKLEKNVYTYCEFLDTLNKIYASKFNDSNLIINIRILMKTGNATTDSKLLIIDAKNTDYLEIYKNKSIMPYNIPEELNNLRDDYLNYLISNVILSVVVFTKPYMLFAKEIYSLLPFISTNPINCKKDIKSKINAGELLTSEIEEIKKGNEVLATSIKKCKDDIEIYKNSAFSNTDNDSVNNIELNDLEKQISHKELVYFKLECEISKKKNAIQYIDDEIAMKTKQIEEIESNSYLDQIRSLDEDLQIHLEQIQLKMEQIDVEKIKYIKIKMPISTNPVEEIKVTKKIKKTRRGKSPKKIGKRKSASPKKGK